MGLVSCSIESQMVNASSGSKPFWYTKEEVRTWHSGALTWLRSIVIKNMANIGDNVPHFVKSDESRHILLFGNIPLSTKKRIYTYS